MSETSLFIGGPADGQRITVTHLSQSYQIMVADGSESVLYHPSKLGGSSKTFRVYVFDGMTGDDLIAALLKGYKGDA